jgi:branched-chain amino acid aminotransferase
MNKSPAEKIWRNGNLIGWDQATIHVMSHVVNYGSALFEGIRCYDTERGPAVFRLDKHIDRLFDSCKIYRMEIPFRHDEITQACIDVVRANQFRASYIRPIALRSLGGFGVNPFTSPVEVFIITFEWGSYLGKEAIENGVDVCFSTWKRMAPNTFPAMAKAAGHYMNSQLIKMEAIKNGYAEGIALDERGHVSEGSGENIFVIKNQRAYTPALNASILPGITRASVMQLCSELGIEVVERNLPREFLYIADEVFFVGTAAEVTPIRSIDKIEIGCGSRGPITRKIQEEFFNYISGRRPDTYGWLTSVYDAAHPTPPQKKAT